MPDGDNAPSHNDTGCLTPSRWTAGTGKLEAEREGGVVAAQADPGHGDAGHRRAAGRGVRGDGAYSAGQHSRQPSLQGLAGRPGDDACGPAVLRAVKTGGRRIR